MEDEFNLTLIPLHADVAHGDTAEEYIKNSPKLKPGEIGYVLCRNIWYEPDNHSYTFPRDKEYMIMEVEIISQVVDKIGFSYKIRSSHKDIDGYWLNMHPWSPITRKMYGVHWGANFNSSSEITAVFKTIEEAKRFSDLYFEYVKIHSK